MVSDALVKAIAEAAAHEEGFFSGANPVPKRANNPCDLTDDGNLGFGLIRTSGPDGAGITIYGTVDDGWKAAYRKFRRMLSNGSLTYPITFTIEQLGLKFSGDPNWGKNVAARLGVTPGTTLLQLTQMDQANGGTWNVQG